MANGQRPFYKGVNFKQFTNKDGYLKGGKEYKVSEKIPVEDQVGGQRRMLKDKKSKVKWYLFCTRHMYILHYKGDLCGSV